MFSGLQKWAARAARERPRAFELIEYFLYLLATIAFAANLWKTATATATQVTPGYIVANAVIVAFIIYVFLRNYFVMHAIDSRRHRENNEFPFVDGNSGAMDIVERILRAAIVFAVIATPKNVIAPISDAVAFLARFFLAQVNRVLDRLGIEHVVPAPDNTALTNLFPYYGTLAGILFLLFLLWDLTNVMTWAGKRGAPQQALGDIEDIDKTSTPYWLLRYYALIAPHDGEHGAREAYNVSLLSPAALEDFNKGSMLKFYLRSPKFYERLFGLAAGLMILVVSGTNYHLVASLVFALAVALYYFNARQNRRYWWRLLGELFEFAGSYLLLRPVDRVRKT